MESIWLRILAVVVAGAGIVAAISFAVAPRPLTTIVSLSPDDRHRVHLVELATFIDRNFELRLETLDDGSIKTIFRSPDEGKPIGSERIMWSVDGSRFLLVGRHFYVNDEAVQDGRALYLMYDIPTGKLWCNAAQQRECPSFSQTDIESTAWQDGT